MRSTKRSSLLWSGVAWFSGVAAVLVGLLAGGLLVSGLPGWLLSGVGSSVWAVIAIFSWIKKRRLEPQVERAWEGAWLQVIEDIVRSFPAITSKKIAELAGLELPLTEQLLTQLIGQERAHSHISELAEVIYAPPEYTFEHQLSPAFREPIDARLRVEPISNIVDGQWADEEAAEAEEAELERAQKSAQRPLPK